MSISPFRHRAWAVGLAGLRGSVCFSLWGLLEGSWGLRGSSFATPWGLFGASWKGGLGNIGGGRPGPVWGMFFVVGTCFAEKSTRSPSLSPSWASLGGRLKSRLGLLWATPPSAAWRPFWSVMGPSWEPLVQSWADIAGISGRPGAVRARKGDADYMLYQFQ